MMTDKFEKDINVPSKQIVDPCNNCNVEPPAMKFKCPTCEHYTEKSIDKIMIDNVDVSGCEFFRNYSYCECCGNDEGIAEYCKDWDNCYYKQLQHSLKDTQEARDTAIKEFNRAEELSCLLKRKEKECEIFRKANDEKNEFLQKLEISGSGEFRKIKYYINKLQKQSKSLQQKLQAEKEKYKQELEEIKEMSIIALKEFEEASYYGKSPGITFSTEILQKCEVLDAEHN